MNQFKHLGLTVVRRFKQLCRLPQIMAKVAQQRREQTVLNAREAERLDRICHPSKYLGK